MEKLKNYFLKLALNFSEKLINQYILYYWLKVILKDSLSALQKLIPYQQKLNLKWTGDAGNEMPINVSDNAFE